MTTNQILMYGNAMEPLVVAELEKQMQSLPSELVQSINISEAIAYALNRLPLYIVPPRKDGIGNSNALKKPLLI